MITNPILLHIKRSMFLRRAIAAALRAKPDGKLSLFGSPIVVDPALELGYTLAWRQQNFSTVMSNDVPILISLAAILGPDDTFLDIGANVGLYSSVLSRMKNVFPRMALHAFEVNPQTAQRLRRSLEGRGVDIHEYGLSDRNGEIVFTQGTTSGLFRATTGEVVNGSGMTCPVRRLDDCGIVGESLVLKIDVEGHEYEVLTGANETFASGRVKAVYLDGYDNPLVMEFLRVRDFEFLNGLTMQPHTADTPTPWLLALNPQMRKL